mmetsp:Transcript_35/g.128  ORF Transcript_35/g.128 Transcript_35/m.128 type:complete len:286 (-) Transcript_35:478-1335(-)
MWALRRPPRRPPTDSRPVGGPPGAPCPKARACDAAQQRARGRRRQGPRPLPEPWSLSAPPILRRSLLSRHLTGLPAPGIPALPALLWRHPTYLGHGLPTPRPSRRPPCSTRPPPPASPCWRGRPATPPASAGSPPGHARPPAGPRPAPAAAAPPVPALGESVFGAPPNVATTSAVPPRHVTNPGVVAAAAPPAPRSAGCVPVTPSPTRHACPATPHGCPSALAAAVPRFGAPQLRRSICLWPPQPPVVAPALRPPAAETCAGRGPSSPHSGAPRPASAVTPGGPR